SAGGSVGASPAIRARVDRARRREPARRARCRSRMTQRAPRRNEPPCLQIRVGWGAATMDVAHLEPPRAFTRADLARDVEGAAAAGAVGDAPLVALDADGWPCLVVGDADGVAIRRAGAPLALDPGTLVELPGGARGVRLATGDAATIAVGA